MKLYTYNNLTNKQIELLCSREYLLSEATINAVNEIAEQVRQSGDEALQQLTKQFDGVALDNFKVSAQEIDESENLISNELKQAIKIAKDNIWKLHENQTKSIVEDKIETTPGVFCWRTFTAIEKVGLYIPGGTAPLFSTVLMLAIPAQIAGCKKIVLCTPADKTRKVAPAILWAAKLLGLNEIYKVGGAQAIFALAYGTKQISKVDKIFGPGNQYVTAAKMKASSIVAIDMPAGPSEVLIIADKTSNIKFVAADLLSQAEHGADSQVVLLCTDKKKTDEILIETTKQLQKLQRKNIASKALDNSFAVVVPNLDTAFEFSNSYAPEHLILAFDGFGKYLAKIQNAGSVFCGKYSSESFGDYASGTNHTLPTSGFAKSYSGVSVTSFGKWITFQEVTQEGLDNIGEDVAIMAENEKLFAHKNAVNIRMQ